MVITVIDKTVVDRALRAAEQLHLVALDIKNIKNILFILSCARLAVTFDKLRGISA